MSRHDQRGPGGGAVGRPHRALRPYVGSYVGYHHVGAPAVHHGVPGPAATVILAFDEPIDTSWRDRPADRATYWTMASGLHIRPALIHTGGFQHGIQLDLTPLGVRVLLGLPVGALATTMVGHDDLPLGIGADVHNRLAAAPTWPARFAILDAALLRLLRTSGEGGAAALPSAARDGWRLLAASRGAMPVAEVAARTGWSVRHLHGRFVAEFGVAPKQRRGSCASTAPGGSCCVGPGSPRRRRCAATPTRPTSPANGRRSPGSRRGGRSRSWRSSRADGGWLAAAMRFVHRADSCIVPIRARPAFGALRRLGA